MQIHESVSELINQQINHELGASYTYLGMSAYFDGEDLPGFASWFRGHAQEEIDHAMRLYDFLVSCDVPVKLAPMEAPASTFNSPTSALAAALKHEQMVTAQIKTMFEVAHECKDYTTQPMLHWFLAEQVEEEDLFRQVLSEVEAAGDNRFNMVLLDKEMAGRSADDAEG